MPATVVAQGGGRCAMLVQRDDDDRDAADARRV